MNTFGGLENWGAWMNCAFAQTSSPEGHLEREKGWADLAFLSLELSKVLPILLAQAGLYFLTLEASSGCMPRSRHADSIQVTPYQMCGRIGPRATESTEPSFRRDFPTLGCRRVLCGCAFHSPELTVFIIKLLTPPVHSGKLRC